MLSDFPPEREQELGDMIRRAGAAVKTILSEGLDRAMAVFNA